MPAGGAGALAPNGTLRFGVVFSPDASTFFVVKDAQGAPHGVTVDLARDLARETGLALEFTVAPNTGVLTDALAAGTLDAAFMPVDDERRKRLDFGPTYVYADNTYLVRGSAGITSIAEVDRPGVRVIAIANTSTIRSAGRTLRNTLVAPAVSIDAALALLREDKADAFALTHDTLATLATRVPGACILPGAFMRVSFSIAVPKGRPAALVCVSGWLEAAKAAGTVRRAFDAAGFGASEVAPASVAS